MSWKSKKPKNPNWRTDNVSPAQVWALMNIGYARHEAESLTKGEASDTITAHKFGGDDNKRFEDEGGKVKRPICTVTPEDVHIPFGHANGVRFPYMDDEAFKRSTEEFRRLNGKITPSCPIQF